MKKIALVVLAASVLIACKPKTEVRNGVEHFEGYRKYQSEALGFQFEYPSETMRGRKVHITERLTGEEDEIGFIAAGHLKMWVRESNEPENTEERLAYFSDLKLAGAENCRLDLDNKSTDKREEYHYVPITSAKPEDLDEKCKIYYTLYYFPEKPGQYLEVSGNETLPFKLKETMHFFDSIKAF